MLIDWFTVGAQTLNFLVLVWLLKRVLYRPVLDAIAARESGIAATLAAAAAAEEGARRQRLDYEQQNAALERHRAELLREATAAAQAEGARLLDAARAEADALTLRRQATLATEQRTPEAGLARRIQQQVFATARQALRDLAGQTLEQQVAEAFVLQLRGLAPPARAVLALALPPGAPPALLRSTRALAPPQRAEIERALAELLGHNAAVDYALAPELVSGVELNSAGYQLSWNIDAYLEAMEQNVAAALRAEAAPTLRSAQTAQETP